MSGYWWLFVGWGVLMYVAGVVVHWLPGRRSPLEQARRAEHRRRRHHRHTWSPWERVSVGWTYDGAHTFSRTMQERHCVSVWCGKIERAELER